MNSYGRLAYERTREYRPGAFAALDDPERFFTTIGQEMAERVPGLRDEILGPQRDGESLHEYHCRGLQAYATAEELAVFDHWLMLAPPEDEDGDGGDTIDAWLNRSDAGYLDEDDDWDGQYVDGQLVLFDNSSREDA